VLILFANKALSYLWYFLSYIAAIPSTQSFLAIPAQWVLCSIIISVLLLIAPRGFPSRFYLASIGLLPIVLWKPPAPLPGEFWVTLLDVGQGLAAIVRTHKHTLVYDTGPRFSANLDAGNAVILPYLRTLGTRQIDTLIVSHGDNDHSGGMQSLLKQGYVRALLTSELERLKVPQACYCQQGQRWEWDGVRFRLLHPPATSQLKGNNASCVLHISNNSYQLLLPGDIHYKSEKILLENNPDLNTVTVLVAPHHGSKTSSSVNFVKRLMPRYVLFPVGYQNRFKFPHNIIMHRYKEQQSTLYSTEKEGAITVKFRDPIVIETFHGKNRRFWH
jgi:competence protein ComEC